MSTPRLIPARAGNTIGFSLSHGVTSAHPRSRGEHTKSPSTTSYRRGSSPLARGTRLYSGFHRLARRLIPARAGNTVKRDATIDLSTAHPRSRGEHPNVCQVPKSELGSSPLARGTLHYQTSSSAMCRLIPARAGNTYLIITPDSVTTAHPRSRGEHDAQTQQCEGYRGSSPLARGTLRVGCGCFFSERLIPARAGNTTDTNAFCHAFKAHPRSRGEHPVAL